MKSIVANSDVWQNLYSQGKSVMSYPTDFLVTTTHRLMSPVKYPKILDYGFGSGANMLFFLQHGYEVSGIEVSSSAMEITEKRVKDAGYMPELEIIKDGIIPFADNSFDAVVAWAVLTYNDWDDLLLATSEIDRVLKPGGLFLATLHAPGDQSHILGIPMGNGVYRSNASGQEGAIVLVLEKWQLERCFPGKKLCVGNYQLDFAGIRQSYWLVSYEK